MNTAEQKQTSVTLYRMHVVKSFEYLPPGGTWYWSTTDDECETPHYQIDCMEERTVVLPEGYFVGENHHGDVCIFGPDKVAVALAGRDNPSLLVGLDRYIGLPTA